ncbi:MAG: UDP-4-amino-4,6-dideoxy-N-acetyl-beta-L-altrosamine transaminase [Rhizobiales bacterium]|nr:UDP-4-amino-4,6-dideoxy-N-acetyl-beta-L-altrosamine transaminase [Hyphomicrobiales bacterium]
MTIPYGRQSIDDSDVNAVSEILRSDWLTQGPTVTAFERALADYCGAGYAVSVVNATAALHIAALALGLEPGNRLWTSPNTFLASANCGRYCGADVDFVDIDPRTYCMSADRLEEKLIAARKVNALPTVVVTVAFAGQSAEADRIYDLSRKYGFAIIDDASHALGAVYKGNRVGSGHFADITVLSFHPVKILTTGEGGMALTNDAKLFQRLAHFRNHGMTRDAEALEEKDASPWYYEQHGLGFNYRLTDIQAALGLSQFKKLEGFLARRRELAERYDKLLAGNKIVRPWQDPAGLSAYHLYPIKVPDPSIRKAVFIGLRQAGIGVQVHYIPVCNQPYYRDLGARPDAFPEAQAYYNSAISLPMFPGLTNPEQDRVVQVLLDLVSREMH